MEYKLREYPLFSACGLNCGLCPRYQMVGKSKCPGCAGTGFMEKHPVCGVLSCCQRKEFDYCYQCEEYPCKKYNGAGQSDSFITHLRQFRDMSRAKSLGMDVYQENLNTKVNILEILLAEYDDGRHKSFFCLAVNLLELQDVKFVMEEILRQRQPGQSVKDKAIMAVELFEKVGKQRNVPLKLRKKIKE